MKPFPIAAVVFCLTTFVMPLSANPEYKEPCLELAAQYLEDALHADDPTSLMRKAKGELQLVRGGKAGFRERAITLLNAGLADAQAGNKAKVSGDITSTLAAIHSAMAHGRGG